MHELAAFADDSNCKVNFNIEKIDKLIECVQQGKELGLLMHRSNVQYLELRKDNGPISRKKFVELVRCRRVSVLARVGSLKLS